MPIECLIVHFEGPVTLYGDNKVVKRMTVESNSANLAEFMEDMDKTYYYEVKAVPITADAVSYTHLP